MAGANHTANYTAILMRFPADTNDPAWRLTSDEVTAYASAWKRGLNWTTSPGRWVPSPPNPIPSSLVAHAGALWRGGEWYTWDPIPGWINTPPVTIPPGQQPMGLSKSRPKNAAVGMALSEMPFLYTPSQAVTLRVTVKPASSTSAYVVEDQPPTGWTISNINEGGVFDTANGKVKWGLFFDNQARTLTYQVAPPAKAAEVGSFRGTANFDGLNEVVIGGERQMVLQPPRLNAWQLTVQPDGSVRLDLEMPTGIRFVVEASADLVHWEMIADQVTDGPVFTLQDDASAATARSRFYRTKYLPQ